jgi:hypothetical protein
VIRSPISILRGLAGEVLFLQDMMVPRENATDTGQNPVINGSARVTCAAAM